MRSVKEERSLYLGKQNQKIKRRKRKKNRKAPSVHEVSLTWTISHHSPHPHFSWTAQSVIHNVSSDSNFDTCTWPVGARKKEEKKATGQKTPVKLVRRNLFTESEEGDENNSTARVPRKRRLSESGGKQDQAKRRFQRRNTVGMYIYKYICQW